MTTESTLASSARRALRAAAHHLDPVVMIGEKGLTSAVLHEIDIALAAHALIKVRVASDDREQRIAFMNEICEKMGCESVQHLGKLLVLWRNKAGEDDASIDADADQEDMPLRTPASRARGPRTQLPGSPAAGMRRPGANDPRPREGRGEGRGYGNGGNGGGYAPRGGGYSPRGGGGDGYAARGGYSRDEAARPPRPSGGFQRPEGRFSGDAANRRFRRADDAPAPDTRPPREGWAPRNRRGEGRNDANNAGGNGRSWGGREDSGNGSGTGGGYGRGAGDSNAGGGGGYARSGGGRWGSRGGSSAGGTAGAPKPRARRRLG